MQSTQFSTTVFPLLKSAKPWVTAAAHTLLCSNVELIKKWVFKGRGLVWGHTVDYIILDSMCVCGGGGLGYKHLSLACRLKNVFMVKVIILWYACRHYTPNYIMKK